MSALPGDDRVSRLRACFRLSADAVELGRVFQFANTIAGISFAVLSEVCRRAAQTDALAAALLANSRDIVSAEHARRLADLAAIARSDLPARDALEAGATSIAEIPHHGAFWAALTAFLSEFGHRGTHETDISTPRWSEDPAFLLDHTRRLLDGLPGPNSAVDRRLSAERDLRQLRRTRPLVAPLVSWLTSQARHGAAWRELGKSAMVRFLQPMRTHVLAFANDLVTRNVLTEPEDVFFCSWWDLMSAGYGDDLGAGFRLLVAERRREYETQRRERAPDMVDERTQGVVVAPQAAVSASGISTLAGMGVSPGVGTGPVRILTSPTDAEGIAVGDVLVLSSLDPAWSILCLRASALVLEIGGSLSHGAIIARELGLPAVVNVRDASRVLTDGEVVSVDGSKGVVIRGEVHPCRSLSI